MKKVYVAHDFCEVMSLNQMEYSIKEIREEVPEEFHDSVYVEFEASEGYDGWSAVVEVSYTRPFTEEEALESKEAQVRQHKLAIIHCKNRLLDLGVDVDADE